MDHLKNLYGNSALIGGYAEVANIAWNGVLITPWSNPGPTDNFNLG